MGVRAALAVLLLFIATAKAAEEQVTFWGTECTMTCPEEGTWFNKDKKELDVGKNRNKYTFTYENTNKGQYYCEYGSGTPKEYYYYYVQGKVCENCFELDPILFGLAIVADVVGTTFVMMIIYRCTKKKSSAGFTPASKTPPRSGGRAPPVPSPDYEQLNARTRSQDTYSVVNRTG